MEYTEVLETLKKKGCRMTPQRKTILGLLAQHQHSLISVEQLLSEAKKENPAINATTVYRNLELLDDLHLLHTHSGDDGSKGYKLVCHGGHHHHILCTDCGKISPIDYCPIAPELEAMVEAKGYSLEGHKLELYGLCPDCQASK